MSPEVFPNSVRHGNVYFVRSGNRRVVKIGWCNGDPADRVRALQLGSAEKLVLIGSFPGTIADERAWHKRFKHLRLHAEWFRWAGELSKAAHPHLIATKAKRAAAMLEKARRDTEECYRILAATPLSITPKQEGPSV